MSTQELERAYRWCLALKSEINEHLPLLRRYASGCEVVTELGTGNAMSSYALLVGRPKKFRTYDKLKTQFVGVAEKISREADQDFQFINEDDLNVSLDATDLLFIKAVDPVRLAKQLELHAEKARKHVIIHDTKGFQGLPGWQVKEQHQHDGGLIVLERATSNPYIGNQVQRLAAKIPELKYSIIIPTYNHCSDLLIPCIESIIKHTTLDDVEVIIVANGCADETKAYVESLGGKFKLVWVDDAIGYTKATNLGILASSGEYVIVLNNDTLLLDYQKKSDWLKILEAPFSDPKMGMTGPLKLFDPYSNGEHLVFFCAMIKRVMLEQIGILDEVFSPGSGEDIDLSHRAKAAGFKFVEVGNKTWNGVTHTTDYPIWHVNNQTFKDVSDYSSVIYKRNGLINCHRHNKDIKLSIGDAPRAGHITVGQAAMLIMDPTKLLFDDNTVSEIIAEHFDLDAIREWGRVLKKDGTLTIFKRSSRLRPTHEELQKQDPAVYGEIFTKKNEYAVQRDEIAGKHVFDVGANKGFFTIKALELGAATVTAVEAQPSVYHDMLLPNIESFSNVKAMNFAISDVDNKTVYISNEDVNSKISLDGVPVVTISLKTLSEGVVDGVLKMDVEGSEHDALMPTDPEVIRRFKTIYIEIHGAMNPNPEYTVKRLQDKLIASGYEKKSSLQMFYGTHPDQLTDPVDVFIEKWVRV